MSLPYLGLLRHQSPVRFSYSGQNRGDVNVDQPRYTGERAFPHLLSLAEGGWARAGLGGEAARVSNSSQSPCPSPETQNAGVKCRPRQSCASLA